MVPVEKEGRMVSKDLQGKMGCQEGKGIEGRMDFQGFLALKEPG